MNVDHLVNHFMELWNDCNSDYSFTSKVYSPDKKLGCEENIISNFEKIKQVKGYTKKAAFKQMFFSEFGSALKSFCGFENDEHKIVLSDDFTNASEAFVMKARDFNEALGDESIAQASRNVWVMNIIQYLFDRPVEINPPVFAYSMLYPYCDNFLDTNHLSSKIKKSFCDKISLKLKGKPVSSDENLSDIFSLLDMIEGYYDRTKYPEVYESMLAIHNAQIKSLSLIGSKCNYDFVLSTGIDKGGSSVLADGYLVNGKLTEIQQKFLFGYGVFLQLIDDLQDIAEDIKNNVNTIFTLELKRNKLDEMTNRLFSFGDALFNNYYTFKSIEIKELMLRTARLLLLESAGSYKQYYSKEYLNKLESYSPVRFKFLNENKNKFSGKNLSIRKITKAIMMSEAYAT